MFANRSFWLRFFEIYCLFLVLIGLTQLFPSSGVWQFAMVTRLPILFSVFGGMTLAGFILSYFWNMSGKGVKLDAVFQHISAFYVAFEIAVYGFAKIMQTQFQAPHYVMEQPIGELSGFWLTWAYFGHSQTMAFILGSTQILGAILLLFRKTRLLGIFVLVPVLVNINLLNYFYDISPLAFYNALHYTFILVFLLFIDYDKLKLAFLSFRTSKISSWRLWILNVVRFMIIGGAFSHIYQLKSGISPRTKLNGEWKVQSIHRKGQTIEPSAWQDSVWTKLYFEWRYGCLFKYHPEKFQDKDLYGDYKIDERKKLIEISFYPTDSKSPPDSSEFQYRLVGDSLLHMAGLYKKDSVEMELRRIK